MRWTCLLVGFLSLTFQTAQAGHSPPKVVLRIHVQSPGEGQSPLEVTTITIPPNGEKIQVRTLPEVTEGELIGVQQDLSGGVRLQFNHVGQVNLSAVTAQNQGRILVVLIDGYVVYAPTIDEQITNGELDIPHPINPQIVQLLQEVVRKNLKQAART
jgi:preprotein translocase subunit SecD